MLGCSRILDKCWRVYDEVCALLQEDMYSYVTYADDQQTKGKGTSIVES